MALLRLPTRGGGGGGFGRDLGSPPGPGVQSTSRLRAHRGPRYTRSPLARGPAGALARSTARRAGSQPAEVRLRLVGLHALVVREQRAQLRPSRLSREVEPLHCRAEAARVLFQELCSPRACEHRDVLSLAPVDDERVRLEPAWRLTVRLKVRRQSALHNLVGYRPRGAAQRAQLLRVELAVVRLRGGGIAR